MAKNTQEAEVIVTLNGQAAKRAIKEMEQEYERLSQAAIEAYKAGNDALGKKLDAQAQKLTRDMEISRRETKKFADVMKNINGASLKELRSAAKQLQSEINKLTPGTQAYITKSKQLQEVNTRIRQLTNEFKGLVVEEKQATFSMKGLADGFNKYFGMATAGIAAITGLSMAFRKAAEEAAKLDDTYADVMKTTGLLHEEVADLDEELMKIDTRTSREQLLLLARDAGKLGIQGKDNILGFVRAADQIQVALGEDLGEGAIRNLGKIADVLGYTSSMGIEKALLSIASSINAVGQASTASEAYLVDFTQRLAGVAAQTKISAANIIGFASGLDQSAMKVEMAATAFQKFVMKIYEDPAKFAEYANMEVKAFADLLNNDANQAIITILKALKDKDGFASLVPIFKDMGLDGARAVSVLAAMATNIQAVTDAQALANQEFSKATSVTDEYLVKNNNLNAQLDKARKEFKNASIALGQSLNPIMLKSTKFVTYLIKALATYGKEIKAVIITVTLLTIAFKAQVIWQKLVVTWTATMKAAKLGLAAATALLTGNIQAATAAWAAMSAVMKTTVFGLVAAAVSALVISIIHLNKETKELTKLEKFQEDLQKEISEVTSDEAGRVQALRKIVEDANTTYENRNAALKELKTLVPDYHASLNKEGELINNNVDALDNYVNGMIKMAKAQAMQQKLAENANKQWEVRQWMEENVPQIYKDATGEWHQIINTLDEFGQLRRHMFVEEGGTDHFQQLRDLQAEEKVIIDMINEAGKDLVVISSNNTFNPKNKTNGNANEVIDKQIDLQKQIRERIAEQMELDQYEQEWQDRFDFSKNLKDPSISDPKANEEFWEKIYSQRDRIVAQFEDRSLTKEYETEMMWLEKLHQNKLLSEETYEKLVFKTKIKYLEKYTEQTSQIANQAESMVTAIQDAALAREEATYQARLTAAGDNAEEREKIEAEHEKKKLDIQKRYADVDMVINIAKTIAAGALAVMQAFAQLGPVAGAIMAAFIGVTTGAEVATIVAQRNAIKNASVNSSGSSAATNTGQRTLTGYDEGGNTPWAASDKTPVGIVHANEYVIPAWMKRREPVLIANLERYRKAGSRGRSGSMAKGFADGGSTSPSLSASLPTMDVSNVDWEAMREFNAVMRYCAENGLFVKYGDILLAKEKHDTFKNQTKR